MEAIYHQIIEHQVKNFNNIPYHDLSLTVDDLRSEAYLIYLKLMEEAQTKTFNSKITTILSKKIRQRFIDIYRVAKRKQDRINYNTKVEEVAARGSKLSRIQYQELPSDIKALIRDLYDNPTIFGSFVKGHSIINKKDFISYLTKHLKWPRKKAKDFANFVNPPRLETKTPLKNCA